MPTLVLCFHGALSDFFPRGQRGPELLHAVPGRTGLKDVIEGLGVPHPEVGVVRLDGVEVELGCVVERNARVEVFPATQVPSPLRFVADGHLGRLATYLRAAGFDTLYDRNADDPTLAEQARAGARVLLTRDVGLLKRGVVEHGRWIRAKRPAEQLAEVARRFELARRARPFTRCVLCNGLLEPREKAVVAARVPPRSLAAFDTFSECPGCARVYWQGTHHAQLMRLFAASGVIEARPERSSDPPSA